MPLFEYFNDEKKKNGAFRVLTDEYVTEDSGTGWLSLVIGGVTLGHGELT